MANDCMNASILPGTFMIVQFPSMWQF